MALVLFSRSRIPLETSSLTVLVMLVVGFELFPFATDDGVLRAPSLFLGFGHEALVAVCALMICGQGLVRTGALEPVGRALARLWEGHPQLSLLLTLFVAALLSAFINNTPIVVLLLPILTSVALRTGAPASGMLMPMGFATLVGGMCTSIGTSTNLLVVAVAADLGLARIGMFDFFAPAAVAASAGIIYLWLAAPRWLPDHPALLADVSPRLFTAELSIPEDSFADGKPLGELLKRTDGQMRVNRIRRGPDTFVMPIPDVVLRSGDRLLLHDSAQNLKEFEAALEGTLYAGNSPIDDENPLTAPDQQMAEIVVVPGSPVQDVSVRDARFIQRYQLVVLALHRAGRPVRPAGADIADVVLRVGDVLLVQGPREQVAACKAENALPVLDATADLPHTRKAPVALLIMAAVVTCAAFGALPIAVSAVAGALLMLLIGCLSWRDATNALNVQVILVVVASLALGTALLQTGGTDYVSQVFLTVTAGASPAVILSGLMLLMALLTNIVSNNAAAVIGTPIAVAIARQLGLPPQAFVLAVLFGANMSYATPMAYKTNLLVMSAGGYSFGDFVRIGTPLSILMWLLLSMLLPTMYGF